MTDMLGICDDLTAEHAALDRVVVALADEAWDRSTPAAGWSIRDSISHLWFFDQRARMALESAAENTVGTGRRTLFVDGCSIRNRPGDDAGR